MTSGRVQTGPSGLVGDIRVMADFGADKGKPVYQISHQYCLHGRKQGPGACSLYLGDERALYAVSLLAVDAHLTVLRRRPH